MISHRVVHESHIAPGNFVRVISGRDIHRTGYVIEILESILRIRETLGSRDTPIQQLTAPRTVQSVQSDYSEVSDTHLCQFVVLMFFKFLAGITDVEVVRSGAVSSQLVSPELLCWRSKGIYQLHDFV